MLEKYLSAPLHSSIIEIEYSKVRISTFRSGIKKLLLTMSTIFYSNSQDIVLDKNKISNIKKYIWKYQNKKIRFFRLFGSISKYNCAKSSNILLNLKVNNIIITQSRLE